VAKGLMNSNVLQQIALMHRGALSNNYGYIRNERYFQ
ncbi:MAG: hypothetical protein ACI9JP_004154, partial [Granulosicoccus sp.]